eukprot:1836160-Alexandrium_andersonii.AAC.1
MRLAETLFTPQAPWQSRMRHPRRALASLRPPRGISLTPLPTTFINHCLAAGQLAPPAARNAVPSAGAADA